MKWPWSPREIKPDVVPLKGIKTNGVRVDAPPNDASDDQWLDFAAVAAMMVITENETEAVMAAKRAWRERAFRAYNAKWGGV